MDNKVFSQLIQLNNEKLAKFQEENNNEKIEKHQLISSILNDTSAFQKMDIAIALNIIIDITNDEKNAFEIYKSIVS